MKIVARNVEDTSRKQYHSGSSYKYMRFERKKFCYPHKQNNIWNTSGWLHLFIKFVAEYLIRLFISMESVTELATDLFGIIALHVSLMS